MLGCWDDDSFFFWFVCSWFKHKNCCQHDNTILFRDPNSLLICTPTLYNINPLLFWVSNQKKIRVCRTTFRQPSKSLLRVLIKRMKVCCRDWLPKFATGLNMIIGCSSKYIWITRLLFAKMVLGWGVHFDKRTVSSFWFFGRRGLVHVPEPENCFS